METLETYGWNKERADAWAAGDYSGLIPARITADHGQYFKVATPTVVSAQIAGTTIHKTKTTDLPKIGDWVAVEMIDSDSATIHTVLPRTSEIVRGHVGKQIDKQVIAANVDLAFIIQPLDHDFSPERLERYIFQLASQHIDVIITLNKADMAHDIAEKQARLQDMDADVITISARDDKDLSAVSSRILPGKTAVIMGSSGAGKSTLTNRLLGEDIQATAAIREKDSKGRHTTVHRELFVLPQGGMIIDTPGIRELQLWGDVKDLEYLFPEVFEAARKCRFSNCTHSGENGCWIEHELQNGGISQKRYRIYLGFRRELEGLAAKREFIEGRRSQQTRESVKRRLNRRRLHERDNPLLDE